MNRRLIPFFVALFLLAGAALLAPRSAYADHAFTEKGAHWALNPVGEHELTVADRIPWVLGWNGYILSATTQWDSSSVIDLNYEDDIDAEIVTNNEQASQRCLAEPHPASIGKVYVCPATKAWIESKGTPNTVGVTFCYSNEAGSPEVACSTAADTHLKYVRMFLCVDCPFTILNHQQRTWLVNHEIGHALGLGEADEGHPDSVMFRTYDADHSLYPTQADFDAVARAHSHTHPLAPPASVYRAGGAYGPGEVRLEWTPVAGASAYEVWVSGEPGYGADGYACGATRRLTVTTATAMTANQLTDVGGCSLLTSSEACCAGYWDLYPYFVKSVSPDGGVSGPTYSREWFIGNWICDPGCLT